jgi:XTP/dITP diphosphohydrolase
MPRSYHFSEPEVINFVKNSPENNRNYIELATKNQNKINEFKRLLKDYEIVAKDIDVEEIQSIDPIKVISFKAKEAFKANQFNPILVEDTSLEIKGLSNKPGTYVKDFLGDLEMRKMVSEVWLKNRDRSCIARVMLGIFDGKEVHYWEGKIEGMIAESPSGMNGFDWDDIFIPKGENRTFAEMDSKTKDAFSMRKIAIEKFIENPVKLNYPVLQLPEPYEQELKRLQIDKLQDKKAINYAYKLEAIEDVNTPNSHLIAENYSPIKSESNIYFSRYLVNENTKSLGLMITDVDRGKLKFYKNGDPILWQMGPERRHLALAQRVEYFMQNQNKEVHKVLDELEINKNKFPKRSNKRSSTIEDALKYSEGTAMHAVSLKEIGYKKISADKEVSRTYSSRYGLFNVIGKYPRSIYALGSLPFTSGWRDVIVMSAIGHMLVFVHRNNINAIDFRNQVELIKSARDTILQLNLGEKETARALSNIGAALGVNPKEDLEKAKVLYNEAGVRTFRIYTINSDPRLVVTAEALRNEFGDDIEIFAGQLVDKKQCAKLISPNIRVDGFIFGHGGGRQCTSATNGMALSTLEEVYQITTDPQFNDVSILLEGGIGTYVGGMLILGVDCILRNAQFTNCVIEQGDLFFEHNNGEICQPYHGSASAATMIVESFNKNNVEQRLSLSGRTRNVEGKSGYIFYKERANSMSFYVDEFKHYAARTLADLGVSNLWELREFLHGYNADLLRLMTPEAIHTGTAYKS